MSLSSQLVSSSNESAASKAALDERLATAQRDNGKFVTELLLQGERFAVYRRQRDRVRVCALID